MAQIYCKYHPDVPARWACRACQINFCSSCVKRSHPRAAPVCPVCWQELENLGAGNAIAPFWQRLPNFFAYPAWPAALIPLLLLSLLSALGVFAFIGIIVQLLVVIAFMKYAYHALEQTALGYLEPPGFAAGGDLVLPFKQVLLLFCFSFANFAIFDLFGRYAYNLTYLLTTLALPASTMVLAVEHSFFSAFNPFMLGRMIRRIGLPYFILFAFLFALSRGAEIAMGLLHGVIPEWAFLPVLNFLGMYFGLIMFTMMGYVIYQYHEVLGFDIEVEPETSDIDEESVTRHPALQESEILIQEGRFEQAAAVLAQQVKANPADLALRQRYHRMLMSAGDVEALSRHCEEYLSLLIRERRMPEAMALYTEVVAQAPGCKPRNPDHISVLAHAFVAAGQPKRALAVLNNFHQTFPSHRDVVANYFLAARIMSERLNQDENARKLLRYLLGQYPQHELVGEIRNYLAVLEKVPG